MKHILYILLGISIPAVVFFAYFYHPPSSNSDILVSVGKSKQVCDKVLGDSFWKVDDIADHWDEIELHSKVLKDGKWIPYQSGTLAQILHYSDLLDLVRRDSPAGKHPSLLSGTIPVIGGEPVFTSACEIVMADPVLDRSITKQYEIIALPDRS